jgi:hypothetical protein
MNVPKTSGFGTEKLGQNFTRNQSPGDHSANSLLEPPRFRGGDRVELVNCPGIPGTIIDVERGKVLVCFDDFAKEPPKSIRPESLQHVQESRANAKREAL